MEEEEEERRKKEEEASRPEYYFFFSVAQLSTLRYPVGSRFRKVGDMATQTCNFEGLERRTKFDNIE